MDSSSPHLAPNRRKADTRGFTIIELGIVVLVIGIITAIGLVNFFRFRNRAVYVACVTNQRHAYEAGLLYVSNVSPGTVTLDVNVLTGTGYLSSQVAECPLSTIDDFNDYALEIVSNSIDEIGCKEKPVDHLWQVP